MVVELLNLIIFTYPEATIFTSLRQKMQNDTKRLHRG